MSESKKRYEKSCNKSAPKELDQPSIVAGQSGARSSHIALPLHYLRPSFLKRLAARFLRGERHGRGNWLRAFADGKVDVQFLRERYDHAVEHLLCLAHPQYGEPGDDHIAAVGWFLSFADQAEEFGVNWGDICAIVTPEEEEALRARIQAGFSKDRK